MGNKLHLVETFGTAAKLFFIYFFRYQPQNLEHKLFRFMAFIMFIKFYNETF